MGVNMNRFGSLHLETMVGEKSPIQEGGKPTVGNCCKIKSCNG